VSGQLSVAGIKRLFKLQLIVMFVLVTASACFCGMLAGKSALAACLVFLIPNMVFARNIFKYKGASSAKQIVRAFYKGESLKLVLSIILFSLVFKFFHLIPLVFFAVYITMQFLIWLAPLIFRNIANPKL
jgi:ATP synthase protein I